MPPPDPRPGVPTDLKDAVDAEETLYGLNATFDNYLHRNNKWLTDITNTSEIIDEIGAVTNIHQQLRKAYEEKVNDLMEEVSR